MLSLSWIAVGAGFSVTAQNISPVKWNEDFGSTTELSAVTRTVQVYNPQSFGINVSGVETFSLYGSPAFQVSDTSIYLFPGDTLDLSVDFLPVHNVNHDIPLVVRTSTGFGHIFMSLTGEGTYSLNYYQSTEDLDGSALKTALKNRISSGYNSLGYNTARDNMYATIDNVNGDVECVYTGRTATFNTRAGANANNFNCEHTFPQGFFSQNEPMRSDIHHLFPTDVSANSQRGNDPFGIVTNASWSQGGSKSGGGKFEPRDIQKGATARAMMYFVVRYQDYSNFFQGQEAFLYQAHQNFPPSAAERQRNDDIQAVQNNRNPFVDYPQFKDRMGSLVGNADLPVRASFYYSDDSISLARGNTGLSTYSFLVYNGGNASMKLYDWQLSDPGLSFSPFLNDTIELLPGLMMEIAVNFDAGTSYQNELLSFKSNLGGSTSYQVPINSDADFSTASELFSEIEVYPNPASKSFKLRGVKNGVDQIYLTDLSGRTYRVKMLNGSDYDISNLSPGIYLITGENEGLIGKLVISGRAN